MRKSFETAYHIRENDQSFLLWSITAVARSVHTAKQQTGNEKVASAAASTRIYWPPEGAEVDRILSKSEYSLLDRQKENFTA